MKNSMYGRITTKVAKAMGQGVYWSDRHDAWMTRRGYRVEGIVRAAIDAKPEENYTVKEALQILSKALRADSGLKLKPGESAVAIIAPQAASPGSVFMDYTGKQTGYVVAVRGDLDMKIDRSYYDPPDYHFGRDFYMREPSILDSFELSLNARSRARDGSEFAQCMLLDEA